MLWPWQRKPRLETQSQTSPDAVPGVGSPPRPAPRDPSDPVDAVLAVCFDASGGSPRLRERARLLRQRRARSREQDLVELHPELSPDRPRIFAVTPRESLGDDLAGHLEDAGRVEVFSHREPLAEAWLERAPTLLLFDVRTPGGDPIRFCREVRRRSCFDPLWLVLMGEDGSRSFRREVYDAGADDYLELPYLAPELYTRVRRYLDRPRRPGDDHDVPAESAPRGSGSGDVIPFHQAAIHVLVADHDRISRRILAHHLERRGWLVQTCENGREAQRLLGARHFHLVLLEALLPQRNGFEILEDLRQQHDARRNRCVLLSGQHPDESQIRAFALGADDFVAKPFNPLVVVSRLERLLGP